MTEPPIRAALEALGLTVDASGIYHPGGGEDYSGDYSAISAGNLARYDVVVLHTTDGPCGADTGALVDWVEAGGALAALHGATIYAGDPRYSAMLGAVFARHPKQQDIAVEFVDSEHPITRGLAPFTVNDELYLYREPPADVQVLAESASYPDAGVVPVSWVREPGAGRVFYLALGHDLGSLDHPGWRALFQRGVRWAMRT